MINRPILSSLLCAVVLTFSSALVQARDFLIEVVVFESLTDKSLTSGGLSYPRIVNNLRLGSEEAVAAGFLPMEQNLTLTEHAASIAQSGRYRFLRHLAWRQPGLDADNAKAVRVALGNPIEMYISQDRDRSSEFYPATPSPTPDNTQSINSFTVNGTISVRLGRFLHMDTRLVFTDEQTGRSYNLGQSRKMRSGELHYIDNPRFGILTQITPLEDSAGASNEAESSETAVTAPE